MSSLADAYAICRRWYPSSPWWRSVSQWTACARARRRATAARPLCTTFWGTRSAETAPVRNEQWLIWLGVGNGRWEHDPASAIAIPALRNWEAVESEDKSQETWAHHFCGNSRCEVPEMLMS